MKGTLMSLGVGAVAGIILSTFAPFDLAHVAVFIIGAVAVGVCVVLDKAFG